MLEEKVRHTREIVVSRLKGHHEVLTNWGDVLQLQLRNINDVVGWLLYIGQGCS